MYTIIPFEKKYQEGISEMMTGIQDEFEILFRNPDGKQISDIAGPENLFWIALNGNEVAGTIGVSRIDDDSAFLRHLFVSKEHRGAQSNVSKRLLDIALNEAKILGYKSIYLGTMEQFKAAQRFYSKNNFVCIPREALPTEMPVSPMDTIFYLLKNKELNPAL
ncbi:GNAT family N-acetyltransferase [Fluviicola taffensis]|jgi:N-acetylglutamate synthase-like GNAT family acetyltransferase|uniref:GCN5-related N-acetyltransferase n=1 Tax=Fluviicola taffensis (strain DSM 16823 / NCIMB 13979 / RW262) TaxID=755732 RepID=F2IA49_FLUTR|nr:GNAT family N-acetyltransferase [Fluviicola taffensis]AEA45226.1 GCN5-related N-acetyltransferase [Fluviicola taffensis DSM 16823]